MVYDNNYFNDLYQGIPKGGYNVLINKLLEGVDVKLGVDYLQEKESYNQLANKIIYTGAIDAYFDYRLGHLEYRSVRFENEKLSLANFQGNAVVNYTAAEVPYTRVIEHKHFEFFGDEVAKVPCTVISKEYSAEWEPGMEPYYPVNDTKNSELYAAYKKLAEQEENVLFGGRLAEYKYYDMDDVIEKALRTEL